MAKNKDWNDKIQEDKEKALKEFNDSEENENVIDFLARMEDKNPELAILNEMNKKHYFINSFGNSARVTNKVYNEVTNREEIEFITIDTFKNIYSNRFIPGYKVPVPFGKWWIENELRNTVESVTFDPSKNSEIVTINGKKYLNLWEGFGVKAKKGSWYHTKRHIYNILANKNKEKFKYIIKWLAWAVQNPEKRAEVCLVFKGEKGAGKSFLFEQFKKIFAKHGMLITDRNRLTGRFTGHFRSLCYLFCDEVYYPGDKEAEGRMKSLITSETLDTEQKNVDAVSITNRLHIVMCTNNEWVIPATKDERRYFMEEVNNKYAQNRTPNPVRIKYFSRLWDEMDCGGLGAMLHDLLKIDLHNWHPRNSIPQTEELQKQKSLNLNYLQQAMRQMLEEGIFPGEYDIDKNKHIVSAEALNIFLTGIEPLCAKFSSVRKAELIKSLGCIKGRVPGAGRVRWEFPELHKMRKNWDNVFWVNNWDSETKWSIVKIEI